jgi:thiamine-phosphate pyrophosphorylase
MIRCWLITAGAADTMARLAAIARAAPRGSFGVQVREKQLDGGALYDLVREVIAVVRPAGAPVWVNDRVDVALAAGADGVHLPERGLGLADARQVARGLGLGASRHDAAGAIAAAREGAALVQLGPIWATPGKGAPLGASVLSVRRELAAHVELVAVGGIESAERAREAFAAGADAVAVIRAAWSSADPVAVVGGLIDAAG